MTYYVFSGTLNPTHFTSTIKVAATHQHRKAQKEKRKQHKSTTTNYYIMYSCTTAAKYITSVHKFSKHISVLHIKSSLYNGITSEMFCNLI